MGGGRQLCDSTLAFIVFIGRDWLIGRKFLDHIRATLDIPTMRPPSAPRGGVPTSLLHGVGRGLVGWGDGGAQSVLINTERVLNKYKSAFNKLKKRPGGGV